METQAVSAVLGGTRLLGRLIHSQVDFAELIESGIPNRAAQQIKRHMQLSEREFASTLGVSQKTLQRQLKQEKGRLSPRQGDRLYRLARIIAFAEQVFEDSERARCWMRQPQRGLGSRIPLELMTTEAGAREIEDLLGRIEYGVFS